MQFGLNRFGLLGGSSAGGNGSPYIDGVFPEAMCEFDFGDSDCYSGSGQTISNLIPTPADGSAQTGYDMFLGPDGTSSGQDPTFSTNKFTFDGADYFSFKDVTNTTWLNEHVNTDGSINGGTYLGVWTLPAIISTNWRCFFGSCWLNTDYGLMLAHDTGSLRTFLARDGSAVTSDFSTVDARGVTNKLVAYTWDSNVTTNNVKVAVAGTSWQETLSVDFLDQSARSISGESERAFVGASSDAGAAQSSTVVQSGYECFYLAFVDRFMTDADLAAAVTHIEGKTGLTIT